MSSFKKPILGQTVLGYAQSGRVRIPLKFGDGVEVDDDAYKGQDIYLSGKDVFLPDVLVKIKMDKYVKLIDGMSKKEATHIFPQVWKSIKDIKKEDVDRLYKEQGEAWSNLMDDIPIYYACRYVLFKTPSPVVYMDGKAE